MCLGQQLRGVWRGNALCRKMPTDTQIGWIFSLFDRLVVCPRVAGCFLLRANVVVQFSVARFEFASRSRYIFFYRRKLCLRRVELLLGQTHCVRAAQARADKFCTFFGKTRSPRMDTGGSCFQVRGRWIERMQIGELFQEIAIRSFALLNAAFHARKLALAHIDIILGLTALLEKRLLLRFQPCNRRSLFAGILLPFFFNPFYSFFDARYSKRDFFLLLLELLERHDFIAQFWKIGRLRSAFASEIDFTFLEKALLVAKRHARSLAPDLQSDLAKACPNETHKIKLYEWRAGKRSFGSFAPSVPWLTRDRCGVQVYSSDSANLASTLKSSSVVVSPVTFAPLAISLSSRRMILPLRVFGSASANRTSSGFAMAAICAPT